MAGHVDKDVRRDPARLLEPVGNLLLLLEHSTQFRTRVNDPVTALMAQEYLAAVVRGEEELERLIGDRAPGLNGT